MNNRLEIDTSGKRSFKSSELSPDTAINDLWPRGKTDRLSKSFNASTASPSTASPSTALNPKTQSPSLVRHPSFNDGDNPMVDMSHLLHNLTFFSGLPSSDAFLKEITGLMKLRPFKAGDTVIHYGDVAKCMYLIVRGELGIISEDHEIEYATLTAGSFVGEIGVLFNTLRSATVVCKTKSLLVSLTSEDIQSKLSLYPEIKEHLHLKGSERLEAIESIKNKNKTDTKSGAESEEKRGKAGFNVNRSSSFRSSSLNSSFNAGQSAGISSTASATPTMGFLTTDAMTLIKSRASSRRSSLNPETAFTNSLDICPNDSLLPHAEPAFTRRKSYVAVDEDQTDQLKLNKSFNASRRKSSIRFELGDLAIPVQDESASIYVPQINISAGIPDYQMTLENIPRNDVSTDISLPIFTIETPSMINLSATEEENNTLPSFMIETPSMLNLANKPENITLPIFMIETPSKINLAEDSNLDKIEDIGKNAELVTEQLKSKEREPRRISVAVWSDPKLTNISQKMEDGIQAPKNSTLWTSITSGEVGEGAHEAVDQDELLFLQKSVGDSYDEELNDLAPNLEVVFHLVNYLSFEDLFKLRGICLNMHDIITEAKPSKLRNINLAPYFRKLNDRSLIAIAKLCGGLIEKLNLHAAYQLTDKSIEKLAKLSLNLTHLNVSDVWEFSDLSMNALSRYCPCLIHVDLSNCRKITNTGLLGMLESCSKLSALSLSYCKNLTNKVFDHESWTRIKELNLHRCTGIGDRGFEFWPLFVDDFGWAGSGSRQLASSTDWGEINSEDHLKGSLYKSGGGLDNLSFGDDLTNLNFDDEKNDWADRNAEPFDSDSLNISESSEKPTILVNELSEENSEPGKVSRFALRSLDLRDCSFLSDTAIASIASSCSQLRILNLSFCCSLTEDFGRYLGCKKLSNLDVSFCGGAVSDEFILEISTGLHLLKALSIRGCVQVSDEGVDHIIKYSRLKTINYTQCKGISPRGRSLLNEKYEIIENNSVCGGIAGWQ